MNDARQSGFGTIHPMGNRGAASLTVMLLMLPTRVWAATPTEGPPSTEPASVERATCEDELVSGDQESGQITRAIELMGRGQERSKSEDYAGAIHFWQQAYGIEALGACEEQARREAQEILDGVNAELGCALLISGGTVLIVAAVRYRRAKSEAHARLAPGRYGLEVRF